MTGEQFKDWLREHLARHRRHDWPGGDEAISFFGCWLHTFKARRVRPDEADHASRVLAERGGAFPDNHLGLLLGVIDARRREAVVEESAIRRAEERAEVDAEFARELDQLRVWEGLTEYDRQRIEAEVEAENPGLVRFPYFVKRLAMHRAAQLNATGGWQQ